MGGFLSVYPTGYPQKALGISPTDSLNKDDLFKNESSGIFIAVDIEHTGKKIAAVGLVAGRCMEEGVFLKKAYIPFPVKEEDFSDRCYREFFAAHHELYQKLLAHDTTEQEAATQIVEFFDDLSLNNPHEQITIISDNPTFDVSCINEFLINGEYRPYKLDHMLRPVKTSDETTETYSSGPVCYRWNGPVLNPDNMYLAHLGNHHKKWGFASELFEKWGIPPVENPNPHDPVSDAETIMNEFTRFRIHIQMIRVVGSRFFS